MIGGESEGGQRSGENDAEWSRTRRGNVGFRWSCVGARGWQVGGWHREGGARGKGRHKGVDKVAIAHGTQLHAPALPPVLQASPFFHPPDLASHPRSATPSALSRPRVRKPRSRAPHRAFPSDPLNPLENHPRPSRSSRRRVLGLLWGSLKGRLRSTRSGKSARQPDGNAAPVASSSR